jgi:hypothetical protein
MNAPASGQGQNPVFSYKALRLLLGYIAFSLPSLVVLIAARPVSSISASYYTNARDVFVGGLFVIGALMWAYNGHTLQEKYLSKVGALAAWLAATNPTNCETCSSNATSSIHYVSAVVLFAIAAYFCLGPFRISKDYELPKRAIRKRIYLACGLTIVIAILLAGIAQFTLPEAIMKTWAITYWAELLALWAFGVAWMVAGHYFRWLVDDEERLKITWK